MTNQKRIFLGTLLLVAITFTLHLLLNSSLKTTHLNRNIPLDVKALEFEPYLIMLDSGHSTLSPGAEGYVFEEVVNQATTEYLMAMLEENPHFDVLLSHDFDEDMTTEERFTQGEIHNVDLFISIHANDSDAEDIQGFEIYPQPQFNPQWEQSYRLSSLIRDQYLQAGHIPRRESGIFYAFFREEKNGSYTRIITESEQEDYMYTYQSFGVLESVNFPSVLIEQGYVSNIEDANTWLSDEGSYRSATLIYDALCEYYQVFE